MSDNTETHNEPQEAPQEISREISRDASRESTPREGTREGTRDGYAPRHHGGGYGQGYAGGGQAGQPGAPAEGGAQTQSGTYGSAPRRMDPSGRRPYGQGGPGGQSGEGGFRRYPSAGGDRGGDRGDRGGDRGDRRSGGRRGSFRREKQDKIAAEKLVIDYKHPEILRRFLTEKGKILSRYITGNSAKNQRRLMREIKRARFVGLLPSA